MESLDMLPVLTLGFFIGMQHATEADHVAAVSSIAADRTRMMDIVQHGMTWGIGHTITLSLFSGAAILLGQALSDSAARPIEGAVGLMLVGLGLHVLWRLWRERRPAHPKAHEHHHHHPGIADKPVRRRGFRWRSLCVGLMHGMAGSGALLVLAATQLQNPVLAILYVLLFGVGSMIGMGLLSVVIAVPLIISARVITWANGGLQFCIGVVTIGIGAATIYRMAALPGS